MDKTHASARLFGASDEEDEGEHALYAAQLANLVALPMVLHATVQLRVLDVISEAGPGARLSPSEIAARLGFPNPDAPSMLDRMLRVLASYSVLTCSLLEQPEKTRAYGLAPVGKLFVPNEDGVSMAPMMELLQDKVLIDSWYKLGDAVVEGGIPFNKVHGMHAFEYPKSDPRFNEVFNKAMTNDSTLIMKQILQCYEGFHPDLKTIVDVGGGLGASLGMIISKYPAIKGINFDLPHVIQHAPPYTGVQHVGGNMFESIPKGDAVFMKWILHDWSDDHCLKLLKNCYVTLPEGGKVVAVEAILPVLPDTSPEVRATSLSDVLMMTQNPGGKERTEEEFLALAKAAGFAGIRLECFVCNFWVIEFYK